MGKRASYINKAYLITRKVKAKKCRKCGVLLLIGNKSGLCSGCLSRKATKEYKKKKSKKIKKKKKK